MQNPFRDLVRWDKAHIFWGDERCVPADDPRSNARMAQQALLEHVPVPSAGIHPIECAELPEDAARRYESLVRAFFAGGPPRLDIVLLGLGENGHTASLFPFTPALGEQERWISEVQAAGQNIHRITMTAPMLNQARAVVFIVSSASKARVLKEVLEGPRDPLRLPPSSSSPDSMAENSTGWWTGRRHRCSRVKPGRSQTRCPAMRGLIHTNLRIPRVCGPIQQKARPTR